MKYEIKKISVWSCVKTGFFIWGMLGFLMGIYMALMMPMFMKMLDSFGPLGSEFGSMTPIALIFLPIMYSLIGAVAGTITTAIAVGFYNLVSSLLGGVSIEIEGELIHPLDITPPSSPKDTSDFQV